MLNKFVSSSIILFSVFALTSCSNVSNNFITPEQVKVSSFEAISLNNTLIANYNNSGVYLRTDIETSFKSEKEAINYVLKKQDRSIFSENKPYAIVQKANSFYVYEMNSKNTKLSLKSYSDLRKINIKKTPEIRLNSIISQKSNIRFCSYETSINKYPKASQPSEIIERLKTMEKDFGKTKDARGIFTAVYRTVSQRVEKEINIARLQGQNKSADFLNALMIGFANKYFEAHDSYFLDNIDKTDESWRMAFDSGRKVDIVGLDKSFNIAEVLALSMNAHILNDLTMTLKDIKYNPNDKELKDVFMKFNSILFEEKNNILDSINRIYGKNVISSANNFFGSVGEFTMQKIFSLMRNTAESQLSLSKDKILDKVVNIGDSIMATVPGGNSINK